jgi:hypothetical protein
MSGCTGQLNLTEAGNLVADKWDQASRLANNSVQTANDALNALVGAGVSSVGAAGLSIPKPFIPEQPSVPSRTNPQEPQLPNLGITQPGSASFNLPAFIPTPQFPTAPTFTGVAPSAPGAISLDLGTVPEFTETPPPLPQINTEFPSDPSEFTAQFTPSSLQPLNVPPNPFTEPSPPTLLSIPTPTLTATAPGSAPALVEPSYPSAPTFAAPVLGPRVNFPLPTLREPDLSAVDGILAGLLAGRPEEPLGMTVPEDQFLDTFNSLRNSLGGELEEVLPVRAVLLDLLSSGSLGFSSEVATLLRDRAFSAEDRQVYQAEQEVMTEWLARGFTLPGGPLEAKLAAVRTASRDKKAALNRDLWLEEAKLEIENLRFAVQQGIQYQDMLWKNKLQLWGLCGDLANKFVDIQIKVLETTVALYNARLSAWKTEADVTNTYITALLQSELAKLDITKAEVDIARLFNDVDRQNVEIYKAELEGVASQVNIYRAQIDAANSILQGQALRIEAFAKSVQAYAAQVQAYEAEWRGYSAQVQASGQHVEYFKGLLQAESIKADIYGRQVDVEKTRLSSDIEMEKINQETHRLALQAYTTKIDVYGKQVDAASTKINADVTLAKLPFDVYESSVRGFTARVGAYSAEAQARAADARIQIDVAKAPLEIYQVATQADGNRAQVYATGVNAVRSQLEADTTAARFNLDVSLANLERYKVDIQAAVAELDAAVKAHDAQVRLFDVRNRVEDSKVDAEIKVADLGLREAELDSRYALAEISLEQTKAIELARLAIQAQSEVARVSAQLAGAALSSLNASASVGQSYSAGRKISCSENYNYSE